MKTISKAISGAVLCAIVFPLRAQNAGEPPLPSLDSILHRVLERVEKESENDRQFNAQYIYSRSKRTETRNSQGELKKKEEQTREHNPIAVRAAAAARAIKTAPPPRAGGIVHLFRIGSRRPWRRDWRRQGGFRGGGQARCPKLAYTQRSYRCDPH